MSSETKYIQFLNGYKYFLKKSKQKFFFLGGPPQQTRAKITMNKTEKKLKERSLIFLPLPSPIFDQMKDVEREPAEREQHHHHHQHLDGSTSGGKPTVL